jgi:hypothetical protein
VIDNSRRQSKEFSEFRGVYDQFRFSSPHPADGNGKPETQIRSSHIGKRRGAELHEESNLLKKKDLTPRFVLTRPTSSGPSPPSEFVRDLACFLIPLHGAENLFDNHIELSAFGLGWGVRIEGCEIPENATFTNSGARPVSQRW